MFSSDLVNIPLSVDNIEIQSIFQTQLRNILDTINAYLYKKINNGANARGHGSRESWYVYLFTKLYFRTFLTLLYLLEWTNRKLIELFSMFLKYFENDLDYESIKINLLFTDTIVVNIKQCIFSKIV